MSDVMASFALAVAPTVVFLARTPAVVEMLSDLYDEHSIKDNKTPKEEVKEKEEEETYISTIL